MATKSFGHLLNDSREAAQLYVKFKMEHARLHLVERLTLITTSLISNLITAFFLLLFLAFASVALALYLATFMANHWAFLIVAGGYCIAIPILLLLKNVIIRPAMFRVFFRELVYDK